MVDTRKTLQELDGKDWGEPPFPSSLVSECHRLRRVPVNDFEPGDFRILIGQNRCLDLLVPLALDIVESDPLVEGSYYPGDLLCALLAVKHTYWRADAPGRARLEAVVDGVLHRLEPAVREEMPLSAFQASLQIFRSDGER